MATNTRADQDGNNSESSDTQSIVDDIWNFLCRPSALSPEDSWPCLNIRDVTDRLIPTVPNGSNIPVDFVEFLATHFRQYETNLERMTHIYFFLGTTKIHAYSSYLLEILLAFRDACCEMRSPLILGTTIRSMEDHVWTLGFSS